MLSLIRSTAVDKKEIEGIKELIHEEFGLKVLNSMISSRKNL